MEEEGHNFWPLDRGNLLRERASAAKGTWGESGIDAMDKIKGKSINSYDAD